MCNVVDILCNTPWLKKLLFFLSLDKCSNFPSIFLRNVIVWLYLQCYIQYILSVNTIFTFFWIFLLLTINLVLAWIQNFQTAFKCMSLRSSKKMFLNFMTQHWLKLMGFSTQNMGFRIEYVGLMAVSPSLSPSDTLTWWKPKEALDIK